MAIEYDIRYYRPHSKQAAFHRMTERVRIAKAGNGAGKSVMGIAEDVMVALGMSSRNDRIPIPNHGWIVSEDHKVSIGVAEQMFRALLPADILALSKWDHFLREFTLPNGSTVGFRSCESGATKFAGRQLHWIHFDEVPDEAVFVECSMRIMHTQGDMWFTMTPVFGTNCWTYKRFQIPFDTGRVPVDPVTGEKDFNILKFSTYDNPHIPKAEVDRKKRELADHEFLTRVFGEDTTPEGMMFPEFNAKIHVVEHEKLQQLQAGWPTLIAMDHGASIKTKGATCALLGALRDDGVLQVHDEYYQEVGRPAIFHEQALRRLPPPGIPMPVIHLDAKATGIKLELVHLGLAVVDANNDHNQGFSRMREYLSVDSDGNPGVVISSRCRHLISDLPSLIWGAKNLNDHAPDTFRYLCCGTRRRPLLKRGRVGMSIHEKEAEHMAKTLTSLKRNIRHEEYGRDGMG